VARFAEGASGKVFQVMLRDGTIYFGVLVVVNLANIFTFLLTRPSFRAMGMSRLEVKRRGQTQTEGPGAFDWVLPKG